MAIARFELLLEQVGRGQKAAPSIVAACRSQSGLASLSIPARGVAPMALNTLKARANLVSEKGGWEGLDALRKRIIRTTKKGAKQARAFETSPDTAIPQSAEQLASEAHRARLRIERAYLDLMQIANSAASGDEHLRNELERHISLWGNELGLSLATKAVTT